MTIQFNTDKSLSVNNSFAEKLGAVLQDELQKFGDTITRLEVYLSDQNGNKPGINDKKCVLEARLSGRQPITATNLANNYELAVDGAVEKLKSSLETIVGKLNAH
jgi:hypothetical protein